MFSNSVLEKDFIDNALKKCPVITLDNGKVLPSYLRIVPEKMGRCVLHVKRDKKVVLKRERYRYDEFYFCTYNDSSLRFIVFKKLKEGGVEIWKIEAYSNINEAVSLYISLLYKKAGFKTKNDFMAGLFKYLHYLHLNEVMNKNVLEIANANEVDDDFEDSSFKI